MGTKIYKVTLEDKKDYVFTNLSKAVKFASKYVKVRYNTVREHLGIKTNFVKESIKIKTCTINSETPI